MKNKKLMIILIIVVVAIILAVGGIVIAYATTDFLKTDEQLFYKYMEQPLAKLQNFKSDELTKYFEKTDTNPYESQGKISAHVKVPETLPGKYPALDRVNSLNITFEGKNDKANKKSQQDIKINYADDIVFPIEYKKNGNLYGLTSSILINTYLSVRMDDVETVLEKVGINDEEMESLSTEILQSNVNINPSTIENFLEKSKTIITENVNENNFSKVDNNTFALTFNKQETMTILKKLSSELTNNGMMPRIDEEQIDKIISNILVDSDETTEVFKVMVKKDGNIILNIADIKLEIQITDNQITITQRTSKTENDGLITIQKTGDANQLTYKIEYSMLDLNKHNGAFFQVQYSDLMSQNVKEDYSFGIAFDYDNDSFEYQYAVDIGKRFVNSIDIQEITENNSLVLNDASEEFIGNIFMGLEERITSVNQQQMQGLGIQETENPLIYATPLGYFMYQSILLNNAMNGLSTSVNEEPPEIFNGKFDSYKGIQKGASIKSLIRVVSKSNTTSTTHIVSINGMSTQMELENYSSGIDTSKDYNVVINIDTETGYVNSINII